MRSSDLDLDQLLADPLVRLMMSSDAVQESDIRRLAPRTRARLKARPRRSDGGSAAQACMAG